MIAAGKSSGFFTTVAGVGDGDGVGETPGRAGGCCEQDTDSIDGKTIEAKSRRPLAARHLEVFGNA